MNPRQQSVLVGAILIGVLNTSYLSLINYICCLGVIIGGIVTIQQYVSRATTLEGPPSVESGTGATLGALAGVGGAILGALFNYVLRPIELDSGSITEDWMRNMVSNMQGQEGISPEAMQQFGQDGGVMAFIFGLAISGIIFAIFGAIGGAIGAAMFGKEE